MVRHFSIAFQLLLLAACAGPTDRDDASAAASPEAAAPPARISLRDYRSGMYFALARGSAEERLAFYSEKRENAATKVPDPDLFAAMLQLFDHEGLSKIAEEGPAPAVEKVGTKAIEIREGDRIRHVVRMPGMTDTKGFDEYVLAFSEAYNQTYALQSVDESEEFRFEPAKSSTGKGSKD